MIRKEGKARWVYECRRCDVTATTPDHFRAIERQQHHERGYHHMFGGLAEFGRAYIDGMVSALKGVGFILEETTKQDFVLVPPLNIPHDPSLLKDRRKWGGR